MNSECGETTSSEWTFKRLISVDHENVMKIQPYLNLLKITNIQQRESMWLIINNSHLSNVNCSVPWAFNIYNLLVEFFFTFVLIVSQIIYCWGCSVVYKYR